MSRALTVIGRGGGLGTILRTLRDTDMTIDVIVAVAEEASPTAPAGGHAEQDAVGELSRSLQALAGDRAALARALRRPLSIDRLGRHPLGSLMLQSLSSAFGELTAASEWLGNQLDIPGAVLPATNEPVVCEVVRDPPGPRLRFVPADPPVSDPVLGAIRRAPWILLAPGPVLQAVLPAAGVPAIATALGSAPGRVVWICDAKPDPAHALDEQLASLWRHGVRVDAILHDPRAPAGLDRAQLNKLGVDEIPRRLIDPATGRHDRGLLLAALTQLIERRDYQHA